MDERYVVRDAATGRDWAPNHPGRANAERAAYYHALYKQQPAEVIDPNGQPVYRVEPDPPQR